MTNGKRKTPNKEAKPTKQFLEKQSSDLRALQVHCYWSGMAMDQPLLRQHLEAHWSKMERLAAVGSTRSVEYLTSQRMYSGYFDAARDRGFLTVSLAD